MKLRELKLKDADRMLKWMHDESIVKYMGTDFSNKTISDCRAFIEKSSLSKDDIQKAIVDETDAYLGTVSLKNIDYENKCAEFAIAICKDAMGKGVSRDAMTEILKYGFSTLKMESIYWYVSKENVRAVRFYDKNAYRRIDDIPDIYMKHVDKKQVNNLYWYIVKKEEMNV
jgi:diamine N-acetyltransferase